MSMVGTAFGSRLRIAAFGALVLGFGPQAMAAQITYSQDSNLTDFTDTITSYGTFSYNNGSTYTPTTSILLAPEYPRVIGYPAAPVYVSFASPTASIVAFDNIDHVGNAWDVFQYKIYGSTDGSSYSLLFDPISVNEANHSGQNIAFTLNSWTGTAPTLLNDTLTPGQGSSVGSIGYEEYFTFGSSYQYYEFLPSTLTFTTGENELELSAVGLAIPSQTIIDTAPPVPEPASLLLMAAGLGGLVSVARRRKARRA